MMKVVRLECQVEWLFHRMKLFKCLAIVRSPLEIVEKWNGVTFGQETYLYAVAMTISGGFFLQGFLVSHVLCTIFDGSDSNRTGPTGVSYWGSSDRSNSLLMMMYFGVGTGSLAIQVVSDSLGRRSGITIASIVIMFLSLLCGLSGLEVDSFPMAALFGFAVGSSIVAGVVYVSEICTSTIRGRILGNCSTLGLLGGCIGRCLPHRTLRLSWNIVLVIACVVGLLQLTTALYLAESPRWLLAKKSPTDCSIALQRFRRSPDVKKEFSEMYRALSSDARLGDSWLDLMQSNYVRIRVLLCVCLVAFSELNEQWMAAAVDLLLPRLALGGEWHVWVVQVVVALCMCVGAEVSRRAQDQYGRRQIFLFGCFSLLFLWLAMAFVLGESAQYSIFLYTWSMRYSCAIVIAVMGLMWGGTIAVTSVVYLAEVFPFRARAKLTGLCMSVRCAVACWTLPRWNGLLSSTRQAMRVSSLDMVILCAVVFVGVFLFVPETNQLMLEDMEELFRARTDGPECCSPRNCCGGQASHSMDQQQSERSSCNRCFTALQYLGSGWLGLRSVRPHVFAYSSARASQHSSAQRRQAGGAVEFSPIEPSVLHAMSAGVSAQPFDDDVLEPSRLHKYSLEMTNSQFHVVWPSYQQNGSLTNEETDGPALGFEYGDEEEAHDFVSSLVPLSRNSSTAATRSARQMWRS